MKTPFAIIGLLLFSTLTIKSMKVQSDIDADLRNAIRNKDIEKVKLALEAGADVNKQYPGFSLPINEVFHGKYDMVSTNAIIRLLIENGANVNVVDVFGESPLYYAIHWGKIGEITLDTIELIAQHTAFISDFTIKKLKNEAKSLLKINEISEYNNIMKIVAILEKYKKTRKEYVSKRLYQEWQEEGLKGLLEPTQTCPKEQSKRFWEVWK